MTRTATFQLLGNSTVFGAFGVTVYMIYQGEKLPDVCPKFTSDCFMVFSLDHVNYTCWLPVHIADMGNLIKTHPGVYSEFMNGIFFCAKYIFFSNYNWPMPLADE